MRTDIATFASGLKSAVAEVRLALAGRWESLVRFWEERLEGIAPEVVIGTVAVVLVVILTLWAWWRRRRRARQRVQTALKALLAPSPSIKPIPREVIPLRLEKRKDRVAPAPLAFSSPMVVREPTPAVTSTSPVPVPEPVKLTSELLRRLEWKRFELLVQRDLEARGVRVESTGVGVEGGVDLHLYRGDEVQPYGFVQCHAHAGRPVTVDQLTAFFALMTASPVEATFVTSGTFSPGAQAWAQTKGVALLSGDAIVARFNALPATTRSRILDEVTAGDYLTPTCRSCDVKLVPATVPAPEIAWVCPRAPRCTYTLPGSAPMASRNEILDAPRTGSRIGDGGWSEKTKI